MLTDTHAYQSLQSASIGNLLYTYQIEHFSDRLGRVRVLPSCRQQIVFPCERCGSRSHLSGVIGPEAERIVAGVAV